MKHWSIAVAIAVAGVIGGPNAAAAAAPANDDIDDATVVGSLPYQSSTDVADATTEAGEPDDCGNARSVWYRYRSPQNARLVASTDGSDYSPQIAVYEGSATALSLVSCRWSAATAFDVEKDRTYFVQVSGRASSSSPGSSLVFALRRQPTITAAIHTAAWLKDTTGRTSITGNIRCSSPVRLRVEIELAQRTSKGFAAGQNVGYLSCQGVLPWRLVVGRYSTAVFRGGPATAEISISAPTEAWSRNVDKRLRLTVCTRIGTMGDDTMRGTRRDDRLCPLAGNDTVRSGAGNDRVYAGPGADVVTTGRGHDLVFGGAGRDRIHLGSGRDRARGGPARDRVEGARGADVIFGSAHADILIGGAGADRCIGGGGRDRFRTCERRRQ